MKIIWNRFIPFKGFLAINLFGLMFVRMRKSAEGWVKPGIEKRVIRHEEIHTAQMKEMLYIFFYVWYVVEWFIGWVVYQDAKTAYRSVSFEREAYNHENDEDYLKKRKKYHWIKYL